MKTLCNIPATLFAAAVLMADPCSAATNSVTIASPFIVDAGSYLTNDVAHVAIVKANPLLPDDTEITVSACHVSSNEWIRLSPQRSLAQFPCDYALTNATNYVLMVTANPVTIASPFLVDAGSYLTNDVAHVAIVKANPLLPDDTEITVSACHVSSNEWVRLSPQRSLAQFPCDYALTNATNYVLMVTAPATFQVRTDRFTYPTRCVRVTADPAVGAVTAPLIVEEWQAVDGGSGQLLSRINHRKLVISPGQQVSVEWPVSNSYVRLPPAGSYLWRSPCAGGLARFGIFSAQADQLSISAGGRTASSVSGVPQLAAQYPLPYGTSRPAGAPAADGSALDVQLSRFVAASGATVRVTWTPISTSLSEAYVPLPSGGDLPTNVTISVLADLDGNGAYTAGEPFGACHMPTADYAAPEVCLTRFNSAIMRMDLNAAVQSPSYGSQVALCDRQIMGLPCPEYTSLTGELAPPGSVVRVRVSLLNINGLHSYNYVYVNLIAFDRRIDLSDRPVLDETLLMDAGIADLGWGELATQASNVSITDIQSTRWVFVLGDGPAIFPVASATNNCLAVSMVNYYESSRTSPVPVTPANTAFQGFPRLTWRQTPTFTTPRIFPYPRWHVSVYTAASGGTIVYEQDFSSPCLDADGLHSATIPILTGALGRNGTPINATNYWWSASPIDAKFTTPDTSATRTQFRLE